MSGRVLNEIVRWYPGIGPGRIAGQAPGLVTIGGAPGSAKIRLYERETGRLVWSTVSKADGSYEFRNLSIRPYVLVAFDPDERFNAAVMDNITPVVE